MFVFEPESNMELSYAYSSKEVIFKHLAVPLTYEDVKIV